MKKKTVSVAAHTRRPAPPPKRGKDGKFTKKSGKKASKQQSLF